MTLAEWRFSARLAWQDAFIRWTTVASAIVVVIVSGFILWHLIPEGLRSGILTMHYTIYLGIDDIQSWPWAFIVPGGMFGIVLVNTILSFGVFRSDAIAARALTALTAVIILIASIGSFFLVSINV